jgi:hypothetical protein
MELGKPVRQDFYPLASTPEIQFETYKKMGIDGRSAEEKLMEELRLEEEKKGDEEQQVSSLGVPMTRTQQEIVLNPGGAGPQVSVIVGTKKNLAPKQNLNKPEKSIQQMQARGLAGQRVAQPKLTSGGASKFAKK